MNSGRIVLHLQNLFRIITSFYKFSSELDGIFDSQLLIESMKKTQMPEIPATGFEGLKQNWKHDLLAGFLVFLIALPLCLGIAKASGFPGVSGIITAIVGGILVTLLHGSHVTIKGPAAGMIVIVLGSVQALGYEKALAVIVVSGVIQMLFGLFRAGKLGDFFPSSAVHGMLAAIGVIIASKQIPNAFGVKPEAKSTIEAILEIPRIIINMHPTIGIIGIISLIILFGMPLIRNRYVKRIPAPLIVLLITIPIGQYYKLDKSFLVNLPDDLSTAFAFPDFSEIFSGTSIYWIIMYALVGSLESLLSTKAVDILDPYKRKSNLDKDLFATGIGNTICGLLGALPMISEIVRSSANINNGAKTKWSNFFHGCFLLLAIVFAAKFINMIPLAALGAMLVFTGFRLASPKVFKETYKVGKEQLLIFATTLTVTLATDLIIGIFSGIAVKLIIHLYAGAPVRSIFRSKVEIIKDMDRLYTFKVNDSAIFSNYLGLKRKLDTVPAGNKIIIDFSNAKIIDHTVMEHMHHYAEDYLSNGGEFSITGLEKFRSLSSHPLSYRIANKHGQQKLSRAQQMKNLAKSLHFSYKESTPVIMTNFGRLESDNMKIKYEGNIVSGNIHGHTYTISDLSIIRGGEMKTEVLQMTVLSVSNLHLGIPIFTLEEEALFDKFMEKVFINDIDFDDFPVFSDRFRLQGINEKSVRNFFKKEIIEYFEKNSIYHIDSLGAELIFYKPKKMMTVEEIHETLEFAKKLLVIIEETQMTEEKALVFKYS
jgi:MFS superfamily sulfate permease-like transporter